MNTIADQAARQQALEVSQSFIVQAPAGSGKTELLTQRYLVLLTTVNHPEEIIALTFTRKAAAEMRQRIMQALDDAKQPPPGSAHAKQTWQLATQVLARDNELDWQLCDNPNRLRVQTIDALCASLTRQMPILSRFGAQPDITEVAQAYYQQAARQLLTSLDENPPWADTLSQLMWHLDNNLQLAERLFVAMLSQRDQWLPYIMGAKHISDLRHHIENSLQVIIEETLTPLVAYLSTTALDELPNLARTAANSLDSQKATSPIIACFDLQHMPDNTASSLPLWLGLAELLLTQANTWRKQVNVRLGFPPASQFDNPEEKQFYTEAKQRMTVLLKRLQADDELLNLLASIRDCPPAKYSDSQWTCIESLIEILPILVAQLTLVFREQGVVDFTEISQQALQALGDEQAPTDLALALDYRIHHILVDEFQDTSIPQFRLLERLTAGWQNHDGRSLFLVGDPMQSIYRFRAAEVGLFLRAQQDGIGDMALESLQLSSNFRSHAGMVDWVNEQFTQLFPQQANMTLGAVPYHPSTAVMPIQNDQAVQLHPVTDDKAQADKIADIITNSQGRCAILVKARHHLLAITHVLQQTNIPYQAVEIETLYDRPIIQDLWSLTRALLLLAERLAWLSVLRAPWCGLSLDDMYLIAHQDEKLIWSQINEATIIESLSDEGQIRLQRILPVLQHAVAGRRRQSLRQRIETTWLALGGPACVTSPQALSDAQAFFNLLDQEEQGADLADIHAFEQRLQRLFSQDSESADARVQVMTIHKSKGLEFDQVILPSLERSAPYDSSPLLIWAERPSTHGNQWLFAPIKAKAQERDPIYQFLRREQDKKAQYELTRLFYVAVTRAKHQLHLLFCTPTDDEGQLQKPKPRSLIAPLWPYIEKTISLDVNEQSNTNNIEEVVADVSLQRLSLNWQSPLSMEQHADQNAANNPIPRQGFLWQPPTAALIGTFIHRQLCLLSQHGRITTNEKHWQNTLRRLGVLAEDIPPAITQVKQALDTIQHDERGRWIINPQHQQATSEYPLSAYIDGQVKQFIIDRTFIDDDNNRWIIDYKTSTAKEDESVAQFLQRERLAYEPQLQQYARIMAQQETRPIRLALYFPLQAHWLELGEAHVTS